MKFFRRTGYLHISTTFWFFKLVSSSSPICESSLPMASSLALKRLLSANLINRSLRPVGSPTSSASSCFTATDAPSLDSGRRSDAPISGRREFHRPPGLNITDVSSPFLSRSLSQMINIMHSPIASGINYYDGDAKGTPNNMRFSKGMSTMIIHGGNKKPSEEEEKENGRKFSTVAAVPDEESHQKKSLRPLSPHLPIYKPQLSSTTSILNRISAIILTSTILGSYVYVKVGTVAFTYPNFYEFCYYSTKIVPIALEISALALVYHVYAGIGHLVADFSGKLSMWKKH